MRKGAQNRDLEKDRKSTMEMSEVSLVKGMCRGPETGVRLNIPRNTRETCVPGEGDPRMVENMAESNSGTGRSAYSGFRFLLSQLPTVSRALKRA